MAESFFFFFLLKSCVLERRTVQTKLGFVNLLSQEGIPEITMKLESQASGVNPFIRQREQLQLIQAHLSGKSFFSLSPLPSQHTLI
jgi:hypothetical protein